MEKLIRITFSIEELQAIIDKAVKTALKDLASTKPGEPAVESKLFSRAETAEFLKISLVTLYEWTKNGILKSYKIGGRVYYKQEELITTPTQVVNRRSGF